MSKTSTLRRERFDVQTKYGFIGADIEVYTEGYTDDYAVIEFTVTLTLPHGFREDNTRIRHAGGKIVLDFGISKDMEP